MENQVKNITIEKLFNENLEKYTIIDLRSSEEADKEKIGDAINLTFEAIWQRLDEIPKEKPVVVYCATGDFSIEITEILSDRGYEAFNLTGGFREYKRYKLNKYNQIYNSESR